MDILTWFHDRSNITFAIAIIGFVISLYNFFRAMWDRRCAFTVEYISHNCTLGHMGHTQFIIRMNIQNRLRHRCAFHGCSWFTRTRPMSLLFLRSRCGSLQVRMAKLLLIRKKSFLKRCHFQSMGMVYKELIS